MTNLKRKNSSIYAAGLAVVARQVKAASYSVLALHTQHAIPLIAEQVIQFYRYWLDLAIHRYTAGLSSDKQGLLHELTHEDMVQYALRGRRVKSFRNLAFKLTCQSATNAQTMLGVSVQELGDILLGVCRDFDRLVQAIVKRTPVPYHRMTRAAHKKFNVKLMLQLRYSFQELWHAVVTDLEYLGILQPQLFFIEHFAKLLGWSMGALADFLDKPTRQVINYCQQPLFSANDGRFTI